MKFRSDISFLRAFSVVMVMLFHFQVSGFTGGFIGVDIFFVISGFLMTQIALKGIEENTFSLKKFYQKRIGRIIPALLVVLVFVMLISLVFFFSSDIRLNAKYVFLSEFFISNIYFWRYTDYFTSHDNILLHTWSLGVEWQFYILYPLLILASKKLYLNKEKIFWIVMFILTFLSFALMVFVTQIDNNFAFYMLPTRFWELSIGGLAYFLSKKWNFHHSFKIFIVVLSLLVISVSLIFFSSSFLWPSWYTVIPVSATVFILIVNVDSLFFRMKPVRFLGDISYSLYLWHWPWFVLFQYFGFIEVKFTIILIILSILSAYLTYKSVETKKFFTSLKIIGAVSLVIAISSTLFFFKPNLLKTISIYDNKKFEIGNFKNKWIENGKDKQFNSCHCFITDAQTIKNYDFEKCLKFDNFKKNILLIGDSHSAQFSQSLREVNTLNILEASAGYTFPFLDPKGKIGTKPLMQYVFKEFIPKNHKKIDLVIVSAHLAMNRNPILDYNKQDLESELKKTILYLEKYNFKYLVVGQSEAYKIDYPKIVMLKYLGRAETDFLDEDMKEYKIVLESVVKSENLVDIYRSNKVKHMDISGSIPYMFDSNHFSKFGADQIVENILIKRINQKLILSK